MSARASLRGLRFVNLDVGPWDSAARKWECTCCCGRVRLVSSHRLLSGLTKSCGCKRNEMLTRHGHARKNGRRTTTYQAWYSMIQRTTNPRYKQAKDYILRGISVCDEWRDFVNFLADMGERPAGLQLDRIDNDRGYSKDNCRWATRTQQMHNTRVCRHLTIGGVTKPLPVWARERGLYPALVRNRIVKCGWTPERAVRTPIQVGVT